MDKRILALGSICAVAVLIGISFTSVVGYSSNNSNYFRTSPLYNIRTNRAIENGEDVTTCDFVGKGKQNIISIPTIDSRMTLIIDRIRGMDDNAFSKFIALFIKNANNDYQIKNLDIGDLIKMFHQLREKPELLNYANDLNDERISFFDVNKLFCAIGWVFFFIGVIIVVIFRFIFYTEVGPSDICWTKCYTCWTECICRD